MKKGKGKFLVFLLVIFIIVLVYFVTPLRSVIANKTADQYIQKHYAQYDFPRSEIVSIGYHENRYLEFATDYVAQAFNDQYIVSIELNGWLPMIVQNATVWEIENGAPVEIMP